MGVVEVTVLVLVQKERMEHLGVVEKERKRRSFLLLQQIAIELVVFSNPTRRSLRIAGDDSSSSHFLLILVFLLN